MKRSNLKKKRGIAIILVLIVSATLLAFVTILIFNTKNQKGSFSSDYERARASLAARAALQLAIYKFRVLPSEFYRVHEKIKASRDNPGNLVLKDISNKYRNIWLNDLLSSTENSPSRKIFNFLNGGDNSNNGYSFGIDEFNLVSKGSEGYVRDYVKIRAWGKYGPARQVLEELIEVQIADN